VFRSVLWDYGHVHHLVASARLLVCCGLTAKDEKSVWVWPTVFLIIWLLWLGFSVARINFLTKIDKWFLCKLRNIIIAEETLSLAGNLHSLSRDIILHSKRLGFSDRQVCRVQGQLLPDCSFSPHAYRTLPRMHVHTGVCPVCDSV
jgi:hypothetical protein